LLEKITYKNSNTAVTLYGYTIWENSNYKLILGKPFKKNEMPKIIMFLKNNIIENVKHIC
jgi:hypothetical protein